MRPQIEQFHKILKSGCTVEDCRLEDAERLKPYLTLMSVVAWRLFWLTHINRQNPEAPCTAILADHEWKALYTTIHRSPTLPERVPSVRQVVRWIAQLGGFLGRKGDGEPGSTTIWRGWSRLADIMVWSAHAGGTQTTNAGGRTRRCSRPLRARDGAF